MGTWRGCICAVSFLEEKPLLAAVSLQRLLLTSGPLTKETVFQGLIGLIFEKQVMKDGVVQFDNSHSELGLLT